MTGPQERFTTMCERYHDAVLGYARRRCASTADAADVVAETFLVAWRRLDEVPDEPARLPWLYGVARRVLSNQRRGERRRHRLGIRLQHVLPDLTVADTAGSDPAVVRRIAAAAAQLTDTDREVLRLLAWEQLDPGQLAVALGTSSGAARVRLHRARRRFAAALQRQGLDDFSELTDTGNGRADGKGEQQ